jgi:hypothetical protein
LRYGRKKLLWFASPLEAEQYTVKPDEMILTWHRWYANKSCPGDWLYLRGKELADTVTAKLNGISVPQPAQPTQQTTTKPATTKGEIYNMPTIKKDSKGKAVKIWQIILGVTADGVFGAITESNTKKYQKAHGLAIDGIVGKNTWNYALNNLK